MKALKISPNYWASLTTMEQEYIKTRYYSGKANVEMCKEIIREARRQVPGFTKIYGNCVEKDGQVFRYSGSDTRKFALLPNKPQEPEPSNVIHLKDIFTSQISLF